MRFLEHRDLNAVEQMDAPDCDPDTLTRTYQQFGLINSAVTAWRRTWVRYVRPTLSPSGMNTLLDIGSGGGDVPRTFARWAARDGIRLQITAIDPDERAHAFAINQPTTPGLTYRRALSSELVAEGRTYDVVTSNHVLHHLTANELGGLLRDSQKLSNRLVIHNDIKRSSLGFALFGVATLPLRGSFIRQDGLTSIRRSYRPEELRDAAPGWLVQRHFPSHQLLIHHA
ncbi:class I SAM-dependent methyltransferase [Arthrobacter sp. H5]|uniref:class I SAM-dependent methyltransferase n=1 Tax=Arthrobacter sp. H5 TaxID=1267973 RepID=UPI000481480E|nr:class I SAM-dependent methyltransferase [Arthrobacter sp. H5]